MLLKFQLKRQLSEVKKNGLFALLEWSAKEHGLSFAYVLAIASRETNMKHISGDRGHGKGIIQIDDRYHPIAKGEYWRSHPKEMIDYGVNLLDTLQRSTKKLFPEFNQYQIEKVAASAYNTGLTRAIKGVKLGDSDTYTTGNNYGRDVLKRKSILTELLSETA